MIVRSPFPDEVIPDVSISDLILEAIPQYGNDVALVDNTVGKSITFKEIHDQVRKCASALYKEGIRRGDVVAICAPNCLEFPIVFLSILACGGTVTTANPVYQKDEVLQQFRISEPRAIFADSKAVNTIKQVAAELPSVQKIFVIGRAEGLLSFEELLKHGGEKEFPKNVGIIPAEDVALLPHSSGTTGLPKCVMLTHRNIVALTRMTRQLMLFDNMSKQAIFYSDRPMFHMSGFANIFNLAHGWRTIFDKDSNLERMLDAIQKYKVTHCVMIPPMLVNLSRCSQLHKYDLESLKSFYCGGAAVSDQLVNNMREKHNISILEVYGMTECGGVSMEDENKLEVRSSGFVFVNTTVKVVDLKTGAPLGPNQSGEIHAMGPQNFKGYLKNPEATKSALDSEGWVHTGDVGHYDNDGRLYITDRIKEFIKYKTYQVPPAEIESVLLKHKKIADVGVIGVPDSYAGEVPMAFVVKADESLTKEDVLTFVQGELTEYKHLRGGVEFTDTIPKSITGKIQRGELKKMAAACGR